ncbi:glycosyltransferase family 9 protein [Dactylosporangium sp. CA-139066]|uniref:glycosyltransferase family 9 protein n=1 Tax=Dactylosporangium sp. CA-139066 TaxID=3239930 RepID=UPI003D8EA2CF
MPGTADARRSVLLVRVLAFGDVLLTLPVIEALANSSRVSHVDLLTSVEYAEEARRSPYVRRVYGFDAATGIVEPSLAGVEYGLLADLHTRGVPLDPALEQLMDEVPARDRVGFVSPYSPSPAQYSLPARQRDEHAVEYYARAVAPLLDAPLGDGRIAIADVDRAAADLRLPPGAVLLAPGARYPWKRWPADRYAQLADRLRVAGFSPVLVGHHFDRPYIEAVQSRCSVPVESLVDDAYPVAAAMAASGLVVANNSGLTALANAAGAYVVCVHSHTLPVMWRPWGPHHADVAADDRQAPCGCAGPAPHDLATPCGKNIPVDEVFDAVLRLDAVRRITLGAASAEARDDRPASPDPGWERS